MDWQRSAPPRDPLRLSFRSTQYYPEWETAKATAHLSHLSQKPKTQTGIFKKLAPMQAHFEMASKLPFGWLDNEMRRVGQQSLIAVRTNSSYENASDFLQRIGRSQIRQTKVVDDDDDTDSQAADGDGEGADAENEPFAAFDDSDADENEEEDALVALMQIQSKDTAPTPIQKVETSERTSDMEMDNHEKRSNRLLSTGLEMIQGGAEQSLYPLTQSTQHALPADELVSGFETPNFRLRAHQRDGIGRILHLEEECGSWLLSDDPGLGKTYQAIVAALLDKGKCPNGITLVIVPLGLLPYWEAEFARAPALRILRYYGADKERFTIEQLCEFDVVITNFETVANQWGPFREAKDNWPEVRCGDFTQLYKDRIASRKEKVPVWKRRELVVRRVDAPLFSIPWRRVVIDEAHRIKRSETRTSQAVSDIKSDKRGCITGTPLQNDYKDFYAIARFLHLEPWNDFKLFQQCFLQPADKDSSNPSAARELDTNMQNALACVRNFITIRREKGQMFDGEKITGVEDYEEEWVGVEYGPENQALQDEKLDIWDHARLAVLRENGRNKQSPAPPTRGSSFLASLTEGLMDSIHPDLKLARYGDLGIKDADLPTSRAEVEHDAQKATASNMGGRGSLLDQYNNAAKKELEMKSGAQIRTDWVSEMENGNREGSEFIDTTVGVIMARLREEIARVAQFRDPIERKKQSALGKILVFSPFLSSLDLVAIRLRRLGIEFYELNGHCNDSHRAHVLQKFEEKAELNKDKDFEQPHFHPDPVRILLASTRVTAEGYNLVHASHVILMGLTWNPFIEKQALSRAHRMGQLLQVTVDHVHAPNSIHERVRRVQVGKMRKVSGVMENQRIKNAAAQIRGWSLSQFKQFTQEKAKEALDELDDDEEGEEAVPAEGEEGGDSALRRLLRLKGMIRQTAD